MSRMPEVGEVVDDVFRVEEELDHGNFGSVYKVHDVLEDRTLALKVLKPGPHDEDELRQRFEREARLIYSLTHPHILRVYYYGETNSGLPYMAMEFLRGTDLKTLLDHHGPLKPALVQRITLETLSALEAAHDLGIIHRDLKPANIFLVDDGGKGHVKVLDFGFAKALDDDQGNDLTAAKTLVGTPAYMSPELVHKKNVGPPSDVYAMGLIMAEMLTGEKIIQIDAVYDTIIFQASNKPIRLPEEVTRSNFDSIIERALAKDVDERYATATDMVLDIEALSLSGNADRVQVTDPSISHAGPYSQHDEAQTVPRSAGHPSMAEVDRSLGSGGGSARNIDPFSDFPDYDGAPAGDHATTTRQNSYAVTPHESQTRRRADSSPGYADEPISDQFVGPSDSEMVYVDEQAPTEQYDRDNHHNASARSTPATGSYELDMDRPGGSSKRSSSSGPGLLVEILLGVLIGAALLGLAIYGLMNWA